MKKALPYILPVAYSLIGTYLCWCVISGSSMIMSLFGGSIAVFAAAFLSALLSLAGMLVLLVYNYSLVQDSKRAHLTVWIEVLECAVLFVPFMAMWEPIVNAAVKTIWR